MARSAEMSVAFPVTMLDGQLADPTPPWEVRCLQELVDPAVLISLGVSKPEWASLPWCPMESMGDTCWNVSAEGPFQSGSRTVWSCYRTERVCPPGASRAKS